MAILPIICSHFCMPPNPDAHPSFRFEKTMHDNPTTPGANHKNKWKSVELIDNYCMVGVTAIPYPSFGVIMNIVSKEDITYRITIGNIPHCTCPYFTTMSSHALRKKENGCIADIFILYLGFCRRWITIVTSLFMHLHIPTTRSYDYLNLLVL